MEFGVNDLFTLDFHKYNRACIGSGLLWAVFYQVPGISDGWRIWSGAVEGKIASRGS